MNDAEIIQTINPMKIYAVEDLVRRVPIYKVRTLKALRLALGTMSTSFPEIPDRYPGGCYGYRWLAVGAPELELPVSKVAVNTQIIGRMLQKAHPVIAQKCLMLERQVVPNDQVGLFISGVARWRPPCA